MRRILLALISILGISVCAQAQINQTSQLVTGSKIGTVINEIGSGVNYHLFTWNTTGTVSACSVKLEQSANGTSGWSDLIAGQACTSTGGPTTSTAGVANYVRVNATTLTGTGTLTVRYTGLTALAAGNVVVTSGTITVTQGTPTNLKTAIYASDGSSITAVTDPCDGVLTTPVDVYLASSTPSKIISATSAKKNYICPGSVVVVQGTGETVSIIEGTGSNCGTGTAIVWGGDTTASHGFAFAANGGALIPKVSGKTANVDTCLRTSGSNPITAHFETIQQ